LELLFGRVKGIWAIGPWEEAKSPETPLPFSFENPHKGSYGNNLA
jgi:hypothetical protein